ncbi:MAG: tetratricopeptide repeat protein [Sphingosinicella sp.]
MAVSLLPLLLAIAAQASSPTPSADAASEHYRICLGLVRSDAARAVSSAEEWRLAGGGVPARQCLGLAYVRLERWAEAAAVFAQAAAEAQGVAKADLHAQAGNAWLAAGEAAQAEAALSAALVVRGLAETARGEAHVDRARARVALGNVSGARSDLDAAVRLAPGNATAWYLSAELARRAGDAARARTDSATALRLAPDYPDILLLAGTLAGQAGDMAEAERLYRRVIAIAPDSEAGRAAGASLATLREVEVPASEANRTPAPNPQPR